MTCLALGRRRPWADRSRLAILVVLATTVVLMHSSPAHAAGCSEMVQSGAPASSAIHISGSGATALRPVVAGHDAAPSHPTPHACAGHVCLATTPSAYAVAHGVDGLSAVPRRDLQPRFVEVTDEVGAGRPGRTPDPVTELGVNRV